MSSSCVTLVKIIIITNRRQMCTFNSWDWTFFMFACNNADDCRYNATHLLEITQIHSLIIVCTWCQLLNGMLALAINQYSSYSVLLLPTVYVIIATFSFVFHWLPFPRFLHPTYIKYPRFSPDCGVSIAPIIGWIWFRLLLTEHCYDFCIK